MMFEIKTEHEDQTDNESTMLDDTIQIKEENEDENDENEFACDGRIDLFKRLRYRLSSKNTNAFAHHLMLSLNSHDDFLNLNNIEEVYKPLAYCDSDPMPYSSCADNKTTDSCLQLVKDKISWNKRIIKFQRNYMRLRKYRKFDRISSKNNKITIPLYLYNFTKLLHKDPDPYFDSNYNWYFAGNGNLCSVDFDDGKYILYSTENTVYIQKFSDTFNNQYECKHTLLNKQMIFETISIKLEDKLIIGLRQKFRIHLLELVKKLDSLTLELFKTIKSDVPFISFFIENSVNVYYTCTNGSVYVYNITTDESSMLYDSMNKEVIPDNWSSVRQYDDNVVIYTNDNSINILDKRDNNVKKMSVFMLTCEKISASQSSSRNQNNIYVASTHNVLLYDLKNTKKEGFRKQWSHGLKSSPIFISETLFNEDELINVTSQLPTDSCMIINTYETEESNHETLNFSHTTYPWHPRSILDSCKKVFLKAICIDPTLHIRDRINMSNCGSMFLKDENKLDLYTLNSIGDIFIQHFTEINNPTNIEELYNKFSQWGEFLSTKNRRLFVASSVIDMTEYQKKLKNNYRTKVPIKQSTNLLTSKKHWKNYIKLFSKCTDMCAQELLDMWGLDNEDYDSQIPAEVKVETWMSAAMERKL